MIIFIEYIYIYIHFFVFKVPPGVFYVTPNYLGIIFSYPPVFLKYHTFGGYTPT